MAYRIFFSGLMVFVRKGNYEQVDVLLLNPCAEHHGRRGDKHAHTSHATDEAACTDRHLPQMTIKATDMAEWDLTGTLHGCGSRHYDLSGKTVFRVEQVPDGQRKIEVPDPDPDDIIVPYFVEPFGNMRHVSFEKYVIDMCKIFGEKGKANDAEIAKKVDDIGNTLVATKVRLPAGRLTAFAPLDNSARQIIQWKIGKQQLAVMAETVMFEPADQQDARIEFKGDEFVTLRSRKNGEPVPVWITAEPRRRSRVRREEMKRAQHFEHYYELLGAGAGDVVDENNRVLHDQDGRPLKEVPQLDASFNTDTPPCPECQTCN